MKASVFVTMSNNTRDWIADELHSAYSCSITTSAKHSVGLRSSKEKM